MSKAISSHNKEYCKGSITVEAAFIMPIVIFTIFALLYLAFYLHDMCRIQGTMDKTLHKASLSIKHVTNFKTDEILYEEISNRGIFYLAFGSTKEDENQIHNYLQQELAKGLFISTISRIVVDVSKTRITSAIEIETKVSLPGIKYIFDSLSNRIIKGEYPVHDPVESIRRAEVVLDTGSKIKGVEELKKKLEGIFDPGK
jgi:hypothetical protein